MSGLQSCRRERGFVRGVKVDVVSDNQIEASAQTVWILVISRERIWKGGKTRDWEEGLQTSQENHTTVALHSLTCEDGRLLGLFLGWN